MKTLVFPINERDYFTTHGRICHWFRSLAKKYRIEIWTQSQEVLDHVEKAMTDLPSVSAVLQKSVHRPLTFEFRDNLAKIFVQHTEGINLPGSDLSIWKTCAFDDFWGHITSYSFPSLEFLHADLIILPLLSFDDNPWEETDVFYSSIAFLAKDLGIPVVGFQLYPVFNGMKLMSMLMDRIIVRKEYEKRYYVRNGIEPEKIHCLSVPKDAYAISTIEDMYENHRFNSQIEVGREELAVVICNHPKFRPQIRQIFQAIEKTGIPVVLCLLKREFVVRELIEDQIIEKLYYDDIRRLGCRFFLIESQSLVPVMMISDVILSPSYIVPLEFAARYGKEAWIYNPHYDWDENINGVKFFSRFEDLPQALGEVFEKKRQSTGITDIIEVIIKSNESVAKT